MRERERESEDSERWRERRICDIKPSTRVSHIKYITPSFALLERRNTILEHCNINFSMNREREREKKIMKKKNSTAMSEG